MRHLPRNVSEEENDMQLTIDAKPAENPAYLEGELITYLGNKRSLLPFIGKGVEVVKDRLAFALERIGKRSMRPSIMDPENSFDVFEADGSCMAPAVSYEEACDLCEITPTKE